ncbi:MAG: hypothetical protein COW00_20385 [Bdellovibrio sp. CG12_big_fil_rev_8_21_14_0_65_39_13]|nr:MAG: hypothetical protein COW78_15595 [Bdellovibrio sp. CG22_combo_CG10-13_8_21_14_all_39_27]PIQ57589.1 MAG: hypothetical protein COW00_20385 [Bdellovibrio sp. CG12_big_fil_rev_8_21_14_0_65_39_13]PIR33862.1 MAG: hypothetical protein COV37_14805 [Bdellovibrio sp. CG11_big_fil_rev_8_21_14_0_20_39_38]
MNKWLIFISIVSSIMMTSCHQKNDEPVVVNTLEQQQSSETLKVIFPHSAEFKKSRQHGAFYLRDQKLCQSCHIPTQNETGEIRQEFCMGCHKNYPHTPQFKESFDHGVAYLKDSNNCKSCHQSESGLTIKVAQNCTTCHQYPHQAGWVGKNHTKAYWDGKKDENLKVSCQHCHQKDGEFHRRNEKSFMSCTQCHYQVPHDFASFMRHPREAGTYRETEKKQCTQCHNPLDKYHKDDTYPSDPPAKQCTLCHEAVSKNSVMPKNHPAVKRAISSPETPVWKSPGRIIERK